MNETAALVIESTAYFLALINPASKIFLLSTMDPPYTFKDLWRISLRSTLVALFILAVLASSGKVVLGVVFHVEIYSLNVAGGIILFIVGLTAVRKGRFYEETALSSVSAFSIVPLAAPLIAGPGTITAAIYFSSLHGVPMTMVCISIALLINFLIMLSSLHIGEALEKVNATGPIIRITGLIVTAVATQMILSGGETWIREVFSLTEMVSMY
ncbi:MAG: MarC family protein [Desulfomonilia bacterium]